MTGASCRAGNAYPSGAPDFTPGFLWGTCCFFPDVCVCVLYFVVLPGLASFAQGIVCHLEFVHISDIIVLTVLIYV